MVLGLGAALLLVASTARGEDASGNVSRKDYIKLQKQVEELKQLVVQGRNSQSGESENSSVSQLAQDVADLKSQIEEGSLGQTKFVATGNLAAGFSAPEHGDSNFSTTFSPILLWKLSDKLLVEAEVEMELEDSDTITKLEYGQIDYSLSDNLTLVAGKFLNPMNVFVERYEPKWINKFPDTPLAVYDGILPESHVGAQLRGAAPVGETKLNYALYLGNGARLNTDEETAGTLQFDNFNDTNGNKAVGGRIGFLPFPNAEVGYGFEVGQAGDPEGVISDLSYVLHSIDFDYAVDSESIGGRFDTRFQYAWSSLDSATYDADGSLGFGPTSFSNDRDGGYVQISYRPTRLDRPFITDLEFLVRYDRMNNPSGAIDPVDEHRTTLGLDYWLDSSTVWKIAYEIDSQSGEGNNQFLTQIATGF